jgi:hypothetical protein
MPKLGGGTGVVDPWYRKYVLKLINEQKNSEKN